MTQVYDFPRAQTPRKWGTTRTVSALVLREMSTTYGRSALGYLWAILEPAAGIMLLTFIFSFAFRAPAIGNSFPLFYATGMLPFLAYMDISQKVAASLRFSRPLLAYPAVTFIDAILARFILNALTQFSVSILVLTFIVVVFQVDVLLNPKVIALGYIMALCLALGIGTLNCYLLSVYPFWERTWAILNRPLFLVSCIFFLFDTIPQPFRDYLWWNPLIHVVGEVRHGVYATYDATYVSHLYVFLLSGVCFVTGVLLLRRYHKDIANS